MIHSTLFAFLYLFASDYYLNPTEVQDLVHAGLELVYVEKYDRSNWGIGAGREICVTGCYEVA